MTTPDTDPLGYPTDSLHPDACDPRVFPWRATSGSGRLLDCYETRERAEQAAGTTGVVTRRSLSSGAESLAPEIGLGLLARRKLAQESAVTA